MEATFFDYTESDSARFQEILTMLNRLLIDKRLGKVESRDHNKARVIIKAEDFQTSFLLIQNRLSMWKVQDLIDFRLIRDKEGNPKRTEYKITFGPNAQLN